jgi:membrane peptidoglycan carboxypeptidase
MDYYNTDIDGQVNVALSERQPGSTIKPIVYMTAFTKGWLPSTIIKDEKISIKDDLGRVWEPQNFDLHFYGNVPARIALGNSLNIPAVKTLQFAGVDAVADMARKMGISTWGPDKQLGLSMALGGAEVRPVDMTSAYTVLANNGLRIPPVSITKIIDADGNTLEDYKVPQGEQLVDPRYAYLVTSILTNNDNRLITYGPDNMLKMPRPAAAKTGTTDDYHDTWTMGYTPNLTVGVWVGNTDNHAMKEVLSSMSAGKIWRESMDTALDYLQLPPEEFQRPPGLVDGQVCGIIGVVGSGAIGTNGPGCTTELFLADQVPNGVKIVQPAAPGATPVPTTQAAPVAPIQQGPAAPAAPRAAAAATSAPGADVAEPAQAAPAPTLPGLFPNLVAPQRTPGPPPQATPQARPAQGAPTNRFAPQPTSAPAQPMQPAQQRQPTAAPKPQQPAAKPVAPTSVPRRR